MQKKIESNLHNYLSDKIAVVVSIFSLLTLLATTAFNTILIRSSSGGDFISQYRPYLGVNKAFKKDSSFSMYVLVALVGLFGLIAVTLAYRYHSRRRDLSILTLSAVVLVTVMSALVIPALLRIS
jgi:uncharacterized membrane protein